RAPLLESGNLVERGHAFVEKRRNVSKVSADHHMKQLVRERAVDFAVGPPDHALIGRKRIADAPGSQVDAVKLPGQIAKLAAIGGKIHGDEEGWGPHAVLRHEELQVLLETLTDAFQL